MGIVVGVLFADAFGDGLELFGHSPYGVVVAAGYDRGTLDVAVNQDLGCQQDQPGLDLAADEALEGFAPFSAVSLLGMMQ